MKITFFWTSFSRWKRTMDVC